MKKSYLMIAAAAGLMLAACSQEDDFVAQNAAAQQGDGAVLFDTYLSNNSTRAGKTGVMTTTTLQQTGFGIVAYHTDNGSYATTSKPNFMWNQYVGYEASNWVYSPLKYWPNETDNDQQKPTGYEANVPSDRIDKVTFFAYSPYVKEYLNSGATVTSADPLDTKNFVKLGTSSEALGLIDITDNTKTGDAKIHYKSSTGESTSSVPSTSVDLLWGTSSGFTYHPVRTGGAAVMSPGLPVKDMEKPALDEKIKFDFKHALARIGMTVVGAFDQVAAGGKQDQNTRITIKQVTISGKTFEIEGILNLNNTKENRAAWEKADGTGTSIAAPSDNISLTITNETDREMNPDIAYTNVAANAGKFPAVSGVTTKEKNVISIGRTANEVEVKAAFKADGQTYYEDDLLTTIVNPTYPSGTYYTLNAGNQVFESYTGTPDFDGGVYYTIATLTGGTTGKDIKEDLSKQQNVWYTSATAKYTGAISSMVDGTTYYTFDEIMAKATVAEPLYAKPASEKYYTAKNIPGYFMVIPLTGETPADVDVTVTIKYAVTTQDPKLSLVNGTNTYKTSEVENEISQKVTLKSFTNGMAYNLRLILGMTSVKVEAEATDWEVGTVESNLPQNLDI